MATVTVGAFTLTDGQLIGPKDYMEEQGDAHWQKILDGHDLIFNMGVGRGNPDALTTPTYVGQPLSPDVETALLISMQTDYAEWKGRKQLEEYNQRCRESQRAWLEKYEAVNPDGRARRLARQRRRVRRDY